MLAVIPGVQKALDRSPDCGHDVKHVAANRLALEQVEPTLHLVYPSGAGRGEVQVKAQMALQPLVDHGVLVGAVGVKHQMDLSHARAKGTDSCAAATVVLALRCPRTVPRLRGRICVRRPTSVP